MELVGPQPVRATVTTRPFPLRALIVAVVLAAAVIAGALAWTSVQATPAVQAASHLLDPALIQVRLGERTSKAIGTKAGYYLLDPALIDLRKGERARLERVSTTRNYLPVPQIHVESGPLAGGR